MRLAFTFSLFGLGLATALDAQRIGERDLVYSVLKPLQIKSIIQDREYCGWIGLDDVGKLIATEPLRGTIDTCPTPLVEKEFTYIASYHTHAAHSDYYMSELPSAEDMKSDSYDGVDGYISTPGGRLWYVETTDMVVSQICGLGCLPSDPRFVAGESGEILKSYRYRDLVAALK